MCINNFEKQENLLNHLNINFCTIGSKLKNKLVAPVARKICFRQGLCRQRIKQSYKLQ